MKLEIGMVVREQFGKREDIFDQDRKGVIAETWLEYGGYEERDTQCRVMWIDGKSSWRWAYELEVVE